MSDPSPSLPARVGPGAEHSRRCWACTTHLQIMAELDLRGWPGHPAQGLRFALCPRCAPGEGDWLLEALDAEPSQPLPHTRQVGGPPRWHGPDETPDCPACEGPMPHVLSLSPAEHGARPGVHLYLFSCARHDVDAMAVQRSKSP